MWPIFSASLDLTSYFHFRLKKIGCELIAGGSQQDMSSNRFSTDWLLRPENKTHHLDPVFENVFENLIYLPAVCHLSSSTSFPLSRCCSAYSRLSSGFCASFWNVTKHNMLTSFHQLGCTEWVILQQNVKQNAASVNAERFLSATGQKLRNLDVIKSRS